MSNIKTSRIIFARNIHCEKWKYIVGLLCIFKFMQCNIENTVTIICCQELHTRCYVKIMINVGMEISITLHRIAWTFSQQIRPALKNIV